jgi:putative component of toxin-antitoxin plasmid stabilization module
MIDVHRTDVFVKWLDGVRDDRLRPRLSPVFTKRRKVTVLLLCGGTKGTQERDIKRAIKMAKELG